MNYKFIALISITIFASCQSSNSSSIIGKWKASSLKNPIMEKEIAKAIMDIDTFGNTDVELRKVVNIDSFKKMRQQMLDLDIAEQQKALQEISYTFSKNGIAYISDGVGIDSAIWTIENKNTLKVDAPALTGIGDLQMFVIKSLTKQEMVLQMAVGADTSEMTLVKTK